MFKRAKGALLQTVHPDDPQQLAVLHSQAFVYGICAGVEEPWSHDEVEAHCIFELCGLFIKLAGMQAIVRRILDMVAKAEGLASAKDLVLVHLSRVLCDWVHAGLDWRQFPKQLAGVESMGALATRAAPAIVPELLLLHGTKVNGQKIDAAIQMKQLALEYQFKEEPRHRSTSALLHELYFIVYARMQPFLMYAKTQSSRTSRRAEVRTPSLSLATGVPRS